MSIHSRFMRIFLLFALCAASLLPLSASVEKVSAQSESSVLIQVALDGDVQQLVADYQLKILDAVPELSIYHIQVASPEVAAELANDLRVVAMEQSAITPFFESKRQELTPGSPEVDMLQRYIGFGSGDGSGEGINPVPEPTGGTKKVVEEVLLDGHKVKLDDKMRRWALDEVRLNQALKKASGAGVVVAVLDTGVDFNHPQLVGHLLPGYDFVDQDTTPNDGPNGVDDDEDGLIDEGVGHGTHVSGIIAMVAPNARILPVRVLNSDGAGTRFDIIQGTIYAVEQGAQVINFSLGATEDSPMLASAIHFAVNRGVTVVAAASGNAQQLEYPAAYPPVIAVGSVRKDHNLSNFSRGYAPGMDVAAPGELVYSTYVGSQYAWWSGSSMATPFVSGGAALMREAGNCSADCVQQTITSEVEAIKDKKKYGAVCGELNLEKAVNKALKAEPAPELPLLTSLSCLDGKPQQLTFEYTGDACAIGTNSQGNRFKCNGIAGSEAVAVMVTKDVDKFSITPNQVKKGDRVTITSAEGKALKNLKLNVGNQTIEFSTTCDVPLTVGDSFGGLLLRSYIPEGLMARSDPFVDDGSSVTYLPFVSR